MAHSGQQACIVIEVGGGVDMVADLVRKNWAGQRLQPLLGDLAQADDHCLVVEANHGERGFQPLVPLLATGGAESAAETAG